jgi:hypothetical protein
MGLQTHSFETSPARDFGEVSIVLPRPVSRGIPPIPPSGTANANSYLSIGVGPDSPRSTGRGGARNRADRESHALSAAQVRNLIAAAAHAFVIGLPLNRMTTIHWGAAGLALADMVKATGRYLDFLTKALARRGCRTAWLWTHENGPEKGWHCHLLAHVPAGLVATVTRLQRRWLRNITGRAYRKSVILSKPIGGRLGLERGNPPLHAMNLRAALSYVLKGASPAAASQFNLEGLEPGGRIIGRRCSTSQNIADKARKAKD